MSIANLQNNIHACQETIYNLSMSMHSAANFSEWLEVAFRESSYKSYSELADAAKITRASVSSLAGGKPQPLTGKTSRPKRETVLKLAAALNKDVDEALLLAGYAPQNGSNPVPKEIQALFQGATKWSPQKRRRVFKHLELLISEEEDEGEEFESQ